MSEWDMPGSGSKGPAGRVPNPFADREAGFASTASLAVAEQYDPAPFSARNSPRASPPAGGYEDPFTDAEKQPVLQFPDAGHIRRLSDSGRSDGGRSDGGR